MPWIPVGLGDGLIWFGEPEDESCVLNTPASPAEPSTTQTDTVVPLASVPKKDMPTSACAAKE